MRDTGGGEGERASSVCVDSSVRTHARTPRIMLTAVSKDVHEPRSRLEIIVLDVAVSLRRVASHQKRVSPSRSSASV